MIQTIVCRFALVSAFWIGIAESAPPATAKQAAQPSTNAVKLTTADGIRVWAQSYVVVGEGLRPIVLLFHQAGSNKSEYAPIAPRLLESGYDALAIDQRSGGTMFGAPNQTAAALHRNASYDSVLPDLEAALAWARKTHPSAPVYVWGSSYSAALVFVLTAKHPREIAGLFAFSPGEYLNDKAAVRTAAAALTLPMFLDSATDRAEIDAARAILDASPSRKKVQFIPRNGVHGASTLRADRNPAGATENWAAVSAFLRSLPLR